MSNSSEINLQKRNVFELTNIYPWLVWSLGAAFFFYKYVLQVSPSVMSNQLMAAFSISGAQLGNLAAFFFYSYLSMQIPVGILLDRYSPRIVIFLAIFITALGTLFFAHANNFFIACLSRGLIGLGAAFSAVSCFKLATLYFPPQRFALIAGLSMTAAMTGAIGGEAPLSYLVKNYNWHHAMLYVACLGFVLAFILVILVKDKKHAHINQERNAINFSLVYQQLKIILQHKQTWLLSLYSGLAFAPVSVFGGLWGVSFLQSAYQLNSIAAATSVSLIFIGFAIGCPISGWLSDLMKKRIVLMAIGTTLAFIAILFILYGNFSSPTLLNCLLFIFGLGASCFFLCFSAIREIHPLIFAATVLGFMNTFDSICEALSEPFIGKLLDLGWDGKLENGARIFSLHDYHLALAMLPIYFLTALVILFFVKENCSPPS